MNVPVLTVASEGGWEPDLVAALASGGYGVTVVRRCVGLADLLAVAATGVARAAVVPADLPQLDRPALARLAEAGVGVVGLAAPADREGSDRLRGLGVAHILSAEASAGAVANALRAVATTRERRAAWPSAGEVEAVLAAGPPVEPGRGRVVAVWGPTGAPGRTTVAVGLADEAARQGVPTLLVDADTYGGVVAQVLGLLDEAPGLAAAARLAENGRLDASVLAGLARGVGTLRVLTGVSRSDRWPEIGPEAMATVLRTARRLTPLTVVDCGFCLEQDEELAFDTAAPRRNGATLAALADADEVLAVGAADPVGLQRLVRGLGAMREAMPTVTPRVVVNRLRRGVVPGDPEREVTVALQRFAGVEGIRTLPYDLVALDRALRDGRTLAECAPSSPLRGALFALATALLDDADLRGRADSDTPRWPERRSVALRGNPLRGRSGRRHIDRK